MGLFGDLFSIPLDIVNIPLKVVDEVVFDGDEVLSTPLKKVNEGVKHVGKSLDDVVGTE